MLLKLGSRGTDVQALQALLGLPQDAIFGPNTRNAVINFQRSHGLNPDGIVGDKTWAVLCPTVTAQAPYIKATRPVSFISVHCSATPEGKNYTVEDIRSWHKRQGWSDVGYHYVIYRDGSIVQGRPVNQVPAAVEGHNTGSIAVCYIGGVASDGRTPKDTRTDAQKTSLLKLLNDLLKLYNLSPSKVFGHNEFPGVNKACPSFDCTRLRLELQHIL